MLDLTLDQLHAIVPHAPDVVAPLNQCVSLAGASNGLRMAALIAQLAHESGGFIYTHEIWGPTAAQLTYEGRADLGNTQPGDGVLFKGRGWIQLTGRANYTKCSRATGIDLLTNPERAASLDVIPYTAAWYWTTHNCNAFADDGDFEKITRAINGGLNGIVQRTAYYKAALKVLGVPLACPEPT